MLFTVREQEVLRILVHGLCNKGIAQQLGISPHTVRDHVSAMLRRTGCANRVQLALRFGQQPPSPPHTHKRTFKAQIAWRMGADKASKLVRDYPLQM